RPSRIQRPKSNTIGGDSWPCDRESVVRDAPRRPRNSRKSPTTHTMPINVNARSMISPIGRRMTSVDLSGPHHKPRPHGEIAHGSAVARDARSWVLAVPAAGRPGVLFQSERGQRRPAGPTALVGLDRQPDVRHAIGDDRPPFALVRRPRRAEVVLLAEDMPIGHPTVGRDGDLHLLRPGVVRLVDLDEERPDRLRSVKCHDHRLWSRRSGYPATRSGSALAVEGVIDRMVWILRRHEDGRARGDVDFGTAVV